MLKHRFIFQDVYVPYNIDQTLYMLAYQTCMYHTIYTRPFICWLIRRVCTIQYIPDPLHAGLSDVYVPYNIYQTLYMLAYQTCMYHIIYTRPFTCWLIRRVCTIQYIPDPLHAGLSDVYVPYNIYQTLYMLAYQTCMYHIIYTRPFTCWLIRRVCTIQYIPDPLYAGLSDVYVPYNIYWTLYMLAYQTCMYHTIYTRPFICWLIHRILRLCWFTA